MTELWHCDWKGNSFCVFSTPLACSVYYIWTCCIFSLGHIIALVEVTLEHVSRFLEMQIISPSRLWWNWILYLGKFGMVNIILKEDHVVKPVPTTGARSLSYLGGSLPAVVVRPQENISALWLCTDQQTTDAKAAGHPLVRAATFWQCLNTLSLESREVSTIIWSSA